MGTVLEITLVSGEPARAYAMIDRCFAEGERLESIFTTWREDGELARLNARAGQGPQPASSELVRILLDARRLARETGGVFDVTVGPLIALWRDAGRRGAAPGSAEIEAARSRVGAERIRIDAERSTLELEPGMSVDLGGLAKGWALDRLGELLRANGFERALLNFGGSSLYGRGAPLDGSRWRVATEDGEILELTDTNLSVSASLGQTIEIAGERYGHIVDPRTGRPIRDPLWAAVEAPDGAIAEAWSTALVVLGTQGLDELSCDSGIRAHVKAPSGARRSDCPLAVPR